MPADFAARIDGFQAALFGDAPPAGLNVPAGEAALRFAVYRNNVMHSLIEALRRRFPALERLLGHDSFGALATEFVRRHPPDSRIMAEYGARMPAFLDGFAPLADYPYLADVARVELARGRAYHAAEAAPIAPERLAIPPERLRLTLHPSVQLLEMAHAGASIWAAQQPGGTGQPRHWGPECALIARDPQHQVICQPIGADWHRFFTALASGQTLIVASAAAGTTDVAPALALLLRHGLMTEGQD